MNRTEPSAADRWNRAGTAATVLFVAAIAAVVSFIHIQHLALTHGQTELAAFLLPLSIDGTVAAASLVLLRAARGGIDAPWLAQVMLGSAVAATLAANVGYGWRWGWAGAALSGWPAYAFIGCTEMAIGMVRRARKTVPARVPAAGKPYRAPGQQKMKHDLNVGQPVAKRFQTYLKREVDAAVAATQNGHSE